MLGCCFLKASITASSNDFWNVEPDPARVAVIRSAVVVVLFDEELFLLEPHALATSPTMSSSATRLASRDRISVVSLWSWHRARRGGTSMNLRESAFPRIDTMMNEE